MCKCNKCEVDSILRKARAKWCPYSECTNEPVFPFPHIFAHRLFTERPRNKSGVKHRTAECFGKEFVE